MLSGEPEYMDPLGDEAPEGWIVTGYPWADLTDGPAGEFVAAYQAKYDDHPRIGSLVGYMTVQSIVGPSMIPVAKLTLLTPSFATPMQVTA